MKQFSILPRIIVLLTILALGISSIGAGKLDPFDKKFSFFQYCTYHQYPVEEHEINTADGYNLMYHRVQAKKTSMTFGKPVVYLQHGLLDSSDTFIVNDEQHAPAFYFANHGYDVWLGNSRGNIYSRPEMSKVKNFWNFTFDNMAKYDLPAALKYISELTHQKINYIGHSQGTLTMFIALAQKYPIESYLQSFHAMGPVVYLSSMRARLLIDITKTTIPQTLQDGNQHVGLLTSEQRKNVGMVCGLNIGICKTFLAIISEDNTTVDNLQRLPVIMNHFPSGTSSKNVVQFAQYVRTGEFKMYDYGAKQNIKVYGTAKPPSYSLTNITFPCHFYVGKYDKLADVQDSIKAYKQMTNSVGKTFEEFDFGHATFIWGKTNQHLDSIRKKIEGSEHERKKKADNFEGHQHIHSQI